MKPTLLILAAGMGSRYGGLKQLDHFGPNGETIIDYSIYDAIQCGYGKIVFIVRKSFHKELEDLFESKIKGRVETDYVDQEQDMFIGDFKTPSERSKPWGTAHAVLCAKGAINEPFAVINADDFYGRNSFEKSVSFLTSEVSPQEYCLIGYELGNTVSPYGTVSRGVCEVDSKHHLTTVIERTKVFVEDDKIYYLDNESKVEVQFKTPVSMNFWGFDATVFNFIEEEFRKFLQKSGNNPKAEFFIPLVADRFIHSGKGIIKVIPTGEKWFGVTYKEDAPYVKKDIQSLVESGVYPATLW